MGDRMTAPDAGLLAPPEGHVLAFFDVDGTLTYRDPAVGPTDVPRPRVADAVRAFVDAGHIAVLSTGRGAFGVGDALWALPFRGAVMHDGAHVVLDGETIVDAAFPADVLEPMIDEMLRVGMSCLVSGREGAIVTAGGAPDPYDDLPFPRVRSFEELRGQAGGLGLCKVDFAQSSYQGYLRSPWLQEHLDYYNVGDGYHELMMPGVTKGSGGRALVEALAARGERPARVYAFGDSENDLAILELADVAVAMGQASERVKARAAYVTDTAANDGVATALEALGLLG